MKVVALSDTHLRPGSSRRLPDRVHDELRDADVILHAGDVLHHDVLHELARLASVHAVLGNNDHTLVDRLPVQLVVDLDGVRVAMIHDSGARKGRAERLRKRFPDADVVVFGHSHEPMCEPGVDGQLLVNPGSPTERRRAPTHTIAVLDLGDGRVRAAKIVDV